MNRPALNLIEAARKRLANATSAEGIRFEEHTAIGMLDTLESLRLIDMDTWRTLRAEFDSRADSRRALLEGGAQ